MTTALSAPRFDLVEIVSETEFSEAFPILRQLGDIETPETIESLTLKRAWSQYETSREQSYSLYAARNKNEVLGVVGLRICDDPLNNGKPYGVINNLVVEEDYRGLGIGSDMLERIEQIAIKKKCDLVIIDTLKSNKKAKQMYEDAGYSHITNRLVKEI